ncbi:unnamed protein product [Gongylonema pulchrum]|uniref:V-type proton ATPase subunit a n=1 Tax=Gongylonema pulchrum TaxID=637853 RepID=A0A183ET72_9BILA|nr:unnamed protein product [Gongylonema pulchrum]
MRNMQSGDQKQLDSQLSRDLIDDFFDEGLKKAMNNQKQLVKGEISEEERGFAFLKTRIFWLENLSLQTERTANDE